MEFKSELPIWVGLLACIKDANERKKYLQYQISAATIYLSASKWTEIEWLGKKVKNGWKFWNAWLLSRSEIFSSPKKFKAFCFLFPFHGCLSSKENRGGDAISKKSRTSIELSFVVNEGNSLRTAGYEPNTSCSRGTWSTAVLQYLLWVEEISSQDPGL